MVNLTPKIGIVTVLYNSSSVLEEFYATLDMQTYRNFVLYVIDNHSPDDSLTKAQTLSQNVSFRTEIFPEPENWGVAKGNNIGIEHALADGCDLVLLSNNDIVLEPSTIADLLEGMQQMHATMAVPKIYFYGTNLLWAAGGRFDLLRCLTPHYGFMEEDCGQYNRARLVEYSATCFMLIHRDVFSRVGLMDEVYFVYYDDSDFVWRAVREGDERLAYIPTARLAHKENTCTGGARSNFSVYYFSRNSLIFAKKHFSRLQRGLYFVYRVVHYLLRERWQLNAEQRQLIRKAEQDYRQLDVKRGKKC